MSKFLDALKPNDLVFGSNLAVRVYHIVRIASQQADDDIASLPRQLSKERRAQRIADIQPDRYHRWNATGLCGVEGAHAFYGNYSRYYWQPIQNPDRNVVCKACLREYKPTAEIGKEPK